MSYDDIRREFDDIKSALIISSPFIFSLISKARIVLDDSIETAGINEDGVIVISPKFWRKLDYKGKAFILAHEIFHLAFRDHKRQGDRDRLAWNAVCDAVNNGIISEMMRIQENAITPYNILGFLKKDITVAEACKMSKEELYDLLYYVKSSDLNQIFDLNASNIVSSKIIDGKIIIQTHSKKYIIEVYDNGGDGKEKVAPKVDIDLNIKSGNGEEIQEGDSEIYGKDGKEKNGDIDEVWKGKISEAYNMQKTIGTIPLGLQRLIDEILKSKIPWRSLLKQAFTIGLGKTHVETWKRPSRKSQDCPGYVKFKIPTVWCLIDTSGSISLTELKQFIGEVYELSKNTQLKVICWDSYAYDVLDVKSRQDVINKVISKIQGGGGTTIYHALNRTLEKMKHKDIVIVLTDGEIYDINSEETIRLLNKVASKSSVSIFTTTYMEHKINGWRTIKLK